MEISKVLVYVGKPVPKEGYPERVIMVAMDGKTGEILKTHISTDVNWGLRDIGYVQPSSGKGYYSRQLYSELYPDGYIVEAIGNQAAAEKRILEILNLKAEQKAETKKKKTTKS